MAGQFDFKLDTSAFTESAEAARILLRPWKVLSQRRTKLLIICTMLGLAKVEMSSKKKYKIFEQQVADIKNGLWDLYEDIVVAEEGYIQADTDAAKAMDGVSEGGVSLSDY